jgi:hypothetical protein
MPGQQAARILKFSTDVQQKIGVTAQVLISGERVRMVLPEDYCVSDYRSHIMASAGDTPIRVFFDIPPARAWNPEVPPTDEDTTIVVEVPHLPLLFFSQDPR